MIPLLGAISTPRRDNPIISRTQLPWNALTPLAWRCVQPLIRQKERQQSTGIETSAGATSSGASCASRPGALFARSALITCHASPHPVWRRPCRGPLWPGYGPAMACSNLSGGQRSTVVVGCLHCTTVQDKMVTPSSSIAASRLQQSARRNTKDTASQNGREFLSSSITVTALEEVTPQVSPTHYLSCPLGPYPIPWSSKLSQLAESWNLSPPLVSLANVQNLGL